MNLSGIVSGTKGSFGIIPVMSDLVRRRDCVWSLFGSSMCIALLNNWAERGREEEGEKERLDIQGETGKEEEKRVRESRRDRWCLVSSRL